MEENLRSGVPCFVCELRQGDNVVTIPVPYGALENMCRALLRGDVGASICVIDMIIKEF